MQHSFENRVHLDCASFQSYAALKFSYDFDLAPRLYSYRISYESVISLYKETTN